MTAVTTVTVVSVPEAGKSEIPVDIKTVRTMPLMTIKCKGSLEAVRHPSQELRGNLPGRRLKEQARQNATQVHDPNTFSNIPPARIELAVPLESLGKDLLLRLYRAAHRRARTASPCAPNGARLW